MPSSCGWLKSTSLVFLFGHQSISQMMRRELGSFLLSLEWSKQFHITWNLGSGVLLSRREKLRSRYQKEKNKYQGSKGEKIKPGGECRTMTFKLVRHKGSQQSRLLSLGEGRNGVLSSRLQFQPVGVSQFNELTDEVCGKIKQNWQIYSNLVLYRCVASHFWLHAWLSPQSVSLALHI